MQLAGALDGVGAGWAAGQVAALSATTIAGAVIGSTWELAPAVRAQALTLARRAERLGAADAEAYMAAVHALAGAELARGARLGDALDGAARFPAALAQTAADVAELAAEAAAEIEPGCRPDLAAAALLAAGAAAAAAHLLSVNLSVGADDPRRSEVNKIAMRAEASAVRALGASG